MIIILIVAVSLAAFQDGHFGIVIAALLVGCALYVLLKARYEGILSGVVYGVKVVCISATHPVRGRGKYIYTYKLAYYDFMKSAIDGKIMATERGDMSISLSAGAQTTLVVWEKDGKLKVLDWAGWIDVDDLALENERL